MSAIRRTAPPASARPRKTPSVRARDAEQQRFGQEQSEDRAARRAQRAQDADLRAPPHHAHRDRVVDQERAHHQRNVAQHAQIPAEGAQHALVLFAARARAFRFARRAAARARMACSTRAKSSFAPTVTSMRSSLPKRPMRLLRVGDIHDDEIAARRPRSAPPSGAVGARRACPRFPGPRVRRAIWEICRALRSAGQIRAVQRHRADRPGSPTAPPSAARSARQGKRGERRHVALVDAAGGEDLEVGLPGERLHGGAEAPGGGVAGEVDGHDHGDAQRDRENGQRGAQQVAAQRAEDQRCAAVRSRARIQGAGMPIAEPRALYTGGPPAKAHEKHCGAGCKPAAGWQPASRGVQALRRRFPTAARVANLPDSAARRKPCGRAARRSSSGASGGLPTRRSLPNYPTRIVAAREKSTGCNTRYCSGPHRRSTPSMRPSRSFTRTSAMAAASAECVAIRIVAPKRVAASRSSAST